MTYFYDEDICFTRLGFPHMLSAKNAPEGAGNIQAEVYFSDKYKPFSGKPEDWIEPVLRDLRKCGLLREEDQILSRKAMLLVELRDASPWLDLGCGAGRFVGAAPGGIGVDVAEAALERARENVPGGDFRTVNADGTLPLGHGEVEFVWCSEVLEHVPDALGLLQEARRVLKPGGRLLVTTPSALRAAWATGYRQA